MKLLASRSAPSHRVGGRGPRCGDPGHAAGIEARGVGVPQEVAKAAELVRGGQGRSTEDRRADPLDLEAGVLEQGAVPVVPGGCAALEGARPARGATPAPCRPGRVPGRAPPRARGTAPPRATRSGALPRFGPPARPGRPRSPPAAAGRGRTRSQPAPWSTTPWDRTRASSPAGASSIRTRSTAAPTSASTRAVAADHASGLRPSTKRSTSDPACAWPQASEPKSHTRLTPCSSASLRAAVRARSRRPAARSAAAARWAPTRARNAAAQVSTKGLESAPGVVTVPG